MAWGGYLPGDVRLPAPPRLAQVLQDDARLVLLDALRHHVQDVVHHLQQVGRGTAKLGQSAVYAALHKELNTEGRDPRRVVMKPTWK